VLFFEPRNQGFGDLLFQTPIFKALADKGYEVSVIIRKKHFPIIENNPYLSKIFYWEDWLGLLALALKYSGNVVLLGRNTITETICGFMFYRSRKIILDQNINLWRKFFSNNHTTAWQELFRVYFDQSLQFSKPQIYLAHTKPTSSGVRKVAVVVGVDKEEKRYEKMNSLVDLLRHEKNTSVYLIGVCDRKTESTYLKYSNDLYTNLINKQNYSEVMRLISSMDVVVGTEGSLVHVSTTLGIPTVVIEGKNQFWNSSNLDKNIDVAIVSSNSAPKEIIKVLGLITG
jgi:ADP-heptose:LPS heptosyltransferase